MDAKSAALVSWSVRHDLHGEHGFPAALAAVCEVIPHLIDCDEVVWYAADTQSRWAVMYAADAVRYGPDVCRRLLEATDDPQRKYYFAGDEPDYTPTRLSDITSDRELRNTGAWADLYHPLGITRQLTIPITFAAGGRGATAFSLNRHGAEFSGRDLSMAMTLQPMLKAVQGSFRSPQHRSTTPPIASPIAPPREPRTPLTLRELEVLSLVAKGFTAISIGYRLQISARTVRKHLEHIYEKTGQRDRLLAVTYARRLGLLEAEETDGQPEPPAAWRVVLEDA